MTPDEGNLRTLTNLLGRKLTRGELRHVEVRKSVTFGDYEIFLHGRLFPGTFSHLAAVIRADGLEGFVDSMLERLRGRKYHFVTNDYVYSMVDLAREVNYVLSSILALSLRESDVELIEKDISIRHNEIFGAHFDLKSSFSAKKEEKAAFLRLSNSVMAEKLVKLTRRK